MPSFNKVNIASSQEEYTDKICKFFNAFENTNTYEILADNTEGADIYSEFSRTAIRCLFFDQDASYSTEHIFQIIIQDLNKLKNTSITFTKFYWIVNMDEEIELSDMIHAINEQHNLPFRLYLWGINTLVPYFEQYNYLFKNAGRYRVRTKYPKFLTPFQQIKQFEHYGVENAKTIMHQAIEQAAKLKYPFSVIANPVSGSGKTSLVKLFIQNQKYNKHFAHIAYIQANGNVQIAILDYFLHRKHFFKPSGHSSLSEQYNQLIGKLNQMEGNNLLILDDMPAEHIHFLFPLKWNACFVTQTGKVENAKTFDTAIADAGMALKIINKTTQGRYGKKSDASYFEDFNFNPWMVKLWGNILSNDPELNIENLQRIFESAAKASYHTRNLIAEGSNLKQIVEQKLIAKFCIHWLEYKKPVLTAASRKVMRIMALLPSRHYLPAEIAALTGMKKKNEAGLVSELEFLCKVGFIEKEADAYIMPKLWQRIINQRIKPDARLTESVLKSLKSQLQTTDTEMWYFINVLVGLQNQIPEPESKSKLMIMLIEQYISIEAFAEAAGIARKAYSFYPKYTPGAQISYLLLVHTLRKHGKEFDNLLLKDSDLIIQLSERETNTESWNVLLFAAHYNFLLEQGEVKKVNDTLLKLKNTLPDDQRAFLSESVQMSMQHIAKQKAKYKLWDSVFGFLSKN